VLVALARRGTSWSHGYELCRSLGLKAGTVYPILIRLAERGQVETSWEAGPVSGRPARHLYRLTAEGARLAWALAAEDATPARRSGLEQPGPAGAGT
jgi:DNA-binding PadR family transcriptional regulator